MIAGIVIGALLLATAIGLVVFFGKKITMKKKMQYLRPTQFGRQQRVLEQ